jgi:hypothetical protein
MMKITPSDDLKHLGTEDDFFQIIPPEIAGLLLGVAVIVCIVLDRLI